MEIAMLWGALFRTFLEGLRLVTSQISHLSSLLPVSVQGFPLSVERLELTTFA